MTDDDIDAYIGEHAPELDAFDVRRFMTNNEKPEAESASHLAWAVGVLQRQNASATERNPPIDMVEEELRRHDEEWPR